MGTGGGGGGEVGVLLRRWVGVVSGHVCGRSQREFSPLHSRHVHSPSRLSVTFPYLTTTHLNPQHTLNANTLLPSSVACLHSHASKHHTNTPHPLLLSHTHTYTPTLTQEAKQLADHWRQEAEQQRHSAACARAPETARSIKLLQDSKLAADEALLQKERDLLQVGWLAVEGLCVGHGMVSC